MLVLHDVAESGEVLGAGQLQVQAASDGVSAAGLPSGLADLRQLLFKRGTHQQITKASPLVPDSEQRFAEAATAEPIRTCKPGPLCSPLARWMLWLSTGYRSRSSPPAPRGHQPRGRRRGSVQQRCGNLSPAGRGLGRDQRADFANPDSLVAVPYGLDPVAVGQAAIIAAGWSA